LSKIAVDLVCLGVEIQRPYQIASLSMETGDYLEVISFLLSQAVFPRELQRAVHRRQRQKRFTECVVRRPQLAKSILFATPVAGRAKQGARTLQQFKSRMRIAHLHVQHAEVVEHAPLSHLVAKTTVNLNSLQEPDPSFCESPLADVDETLIAHACRYADFISHETRGVACLAVEVKCLVQPTLVPGEEAEGIVRPEEITSQAYAQLERQRFITKRTRTLEISRLPRRQAQPGQCSRLEGRVAIGLSATTQCLKQGSSAIEFGAIVDFFCRICGGVGARTRRTSRARRKRGGRRVLACLRIARSRAG
jgi:hypothetical protein